MFRRKTLWLVWVFFLTFSFLGSVGLSCMRASAAGSDPSIQVQAFPVKAVTDRHDRQTIFLIVQDQNWMPVQGAEASIAVQLPDGKQQLIIVKQPTGINGMTQASFPISSDAVGIVIIHVRAAFSRMEAETSTSFRIWY